MLELLEFSGATGYLVLTLGIFGALPALGSLGLGQRALTLSLALLVLSVLPASLGALRARFERARAEEVIAMADPMDQEVIRMGTESELLNLPLFGLWASLLPSVIGCALLGVGLSRLPRFAPRSV